MKKSNHGCIYMIYNRVNHKRYIGSTLDFTLRRIRHKYTLNSFKHHNKHLQLSWNKYGKNNFLFIIIECLLNADVQYEREEFWIKFYKTRNKLKGYNIGEAARVPELKGENHPFSLFKDKQILDIVDKLNDGWYTISIADFYGVSSDIISSIKTGKTYKHLTKGLIKTVVRRNHRPHVLTIEKVREIKLALLGGCSTSVLAKKFSCAPQTISNIKYERRWIGV